MLIIVCPSSSVCVEAAVRDWALISADMTEAACTGLDVTSWISAWPFLLRKNPPYGCSNRDVAPVT